MADDTVRAFSRTGDSAEEGETAGTAYEKEHNLLSEDNDTVLNVVKTSDMKTSDMKGTFTEVLDNGQKKNADHTQTSTTTTNDVQIASINTNPFEVDGVDYRKYFWKLPLSFALSPIIDAHITAPARSVYRFGEKWRHTWSRVPHRYLAHHLVMDSWGQGSRGQIGNARLNTELVPSNVVLPSAMHEDCVDLRDEMFPKQTKKPWELTRPAPDHEADIFERKTAAFGLSTTSKIDRDAMRTMTTGSCVRKSMLEFPHQRVSAGTAHSLWLVGGRVFQCGDGQSTPLLVRDLAPFRVGGVFCGGNACFAIGGTPSPALLQRRKYLENVLDQLRSLQAAPQGATEPVKNFENSGLEANALHLDEQQRTRVSEIVATGNSQNGNGENTEQSDTIQNKAQESNAGVKKASLPVRNDAVSKNPIPGPWRRRKKKKKSERQNQEQHKPWDDETKLPPPTLCGPYFAKMVQDAEKALKLVVDKIELQEEARGRVWSWGGNDCAILGHGKLYKYIQGESRTDGTVIKRPTTKKVRPYRGVHSLNRRTSTVYDTTKDPDIFDDEVSMATQRQVMSEFCAEDIEDEHPEDFEEVMFLQKPRPVPRFYFGFRRVLQIAVGTQHALARNDLGQLFAWGHGRHGRLGLGKKVELASRPRKVTVDRKGAGPLHSFCCSHDGTPYTWGDNSCGQLGHGSLGEHEWKPKPLMFFVKGGDGVDVDGREFAKMYSAEPVAGSFANCVEGEAKLNITVDDKLIQVRKANGSKKRKSIMAIKSAALGSDHTIFLSHPRLKALPRTRRSQLIAPVFACGSNKYGQLGLPEFMGKNVPLPTRVLFNLEWCHVVAVKSGYRHAVAVDVAGASWAWGYNFYGQLGMGHCRPCLVPTKVPGPKFFHPSSFLQRIPPKTDKLPLCGSEMLRSTAAEYDRLVEPHPDTHMLEEPASSITAGFMLNRVLQKADRYATISMDCGSNFTLRASYVRYETLTNTRSIRVQRRQAIQEGYDGPPVIHCARNTAAEVVPSRMFHYVRRLQPLRGREVLEYAAASEATWLRFLHHRAPFFVPGIVCTACLRLLTPFRPITERVYCNEALQFCAMGNHRDCPRMFPCREDQIAEEIDMVEEDVAPSKFAEHDHTNNHIEAKAIDDTERVWARHTDVKSGRVYEVNTLSGETRQVEDSKNDNGMNEEEDSNQITPLLQSHDAQSGLQTNPTISSANLSETRSFGSTFTKSTKLRNTAPYKRRLLSEFEARSFWADFIHKRDESLREAAAADAAAAEAKAVLFEVNKLDESNEEALSAALARHDEGSGITVGLADAQDSKLKKNKKRRKRGNKVNQDKEKTAKRFIDLAEGEPNDRAGQETAIDSHNDLQPW